MAESDRRGRRTDVVLGEQRTRPAGTRGLGPARQLNSFRPTPADGVQPAGIPEVEKSSSTPEEPAGGLLREISILEVPTRRGPARVRIDAPAGDPRSMLVLGHGAGGDVDAPDLVAVTAAVVPCGVLVVRVTQPYRVAGRRAPAPANHLDEAWVDVVRDLVPMRPLVVGGRSSGARVACRTAAALAAAGVIALAFPTHPPGKPERTRIDELPLDRPTLVVNGDRDPFGVPPIVGDMTLRVLEGADHGLKKATGPAAAFVLAWMKAHGWAA